MAYNGLGALTVASNDVLSDGQAEHFKVDAIGIIGAVVGTFATAYSVTTIGRCALEARAP